MFQILNRWWQSRTRRQSLLQHIPKILNGVMVWTLPICVCENVSCSLSNSGPHLEPDESWKDHFGKNIDGTRWSLRYLADSMLLVQACTVGTKPDGSITLSASLHDHHSITGYIWMDSSDQRPLFHCSRVYSLCPPPASCFHMTTQLFSPSVSNSLQVVPVELLLLSPLNVALSSFVFVWLYTMFPNKQWTILNLIFSVSTLFSEFTLLDVCQWFEPSQTD